MPDADRILKQHDLFPPLQATLSDQNGPIDLTTATAVKLLMKTTDGRISVTGACAIVDAVNGVVRYQWVRGDTDNIGEYNVEFEITWPTALPETVPNDGYNLISIEADLG